MAAKFAKKKILVVDDEEEVLIHFAKILKRNHYQVIVTTKGIEAIELARRLEPDLIILDRILPDIDGGDVASVLSEDHSTAEIPILFITGVYTESESPAAKQPGKFFVMEKPILDQELLKTTAQILSAP